MHLLRIVAFLGYELPPERHQGFHDYMEEVSVEEDNYSDRFRLTVLPALGNVTRHPGAAPAPRRAAVLNSDPAARSMDGIDTGARRR